MVPSRILVKKVGAEARMRGWFQKMTTATKTPNDTTIPKVVTTMTATSVGAPMDCEKFRSAQVGIG